MTGWADLKQYLSACLEEGMRCFPAVPEGIRRVTPPSGATICGHFIPGGVSHILSNKGINTDPSFSKQVKVSIPHYAAYHLPQNFTSPNSLLPERWLPASHPLHDPGFALDNKDVLQPFSVGPRNCIGLTLAYHEMRLIMANLLWHFDVKLAEEADPKWLEQTVHLVWDKKPLMVRIEGRGDGKV